MPARFTPLVTDNYYHVFNRGVNKQPIFNGVKDYKRLLNLLRFYNYADHPVRFSKFLLLSNDQRKEIWNRLENSSTLLNIITYCFMPNHFHLLVKQNIENGTSRFLANIQISYTKYFNIKNDRVGPLLQGQFKAVKIDSEEQLLHLSRYIHLNPFSSALVKNIKDIADYGWSSFKEYLEDVDYPVCRHDLINGYFSNKDKYKDFVLDNADYQKNLEYVKHLTIES
ncbi:MAG: transposase [bacterium]|nr:transposase [bacterium]